VQRPGGPGGGARGLAGAGNGVERLISSRNPEQFRARVSDTFRSERWTGKPRSCSLAHRISTCLIGPSSMVRDARAGTLYVTEIFTGRMIQIPGQ
jgi:hypothetical protein